MSEIVVRVAIVHEWLAKRAGSEKVFEELARIFPHADLFALTINPDVVFEIDRPVTTTLLQHHRMLRSSRALTLPLMPLAWKMLGRRRYDILISSSHAFARYFPVDVDYHFNYVHAPMRYAWTPEIDGRASSKLLAPARALLRSADLRSTDQVHSFAGNSTAVSERIQSFYGRDSKVIFPPVDLSRFTPSEDSRDRDDYLLGFSRWIPYKRLETVLRVAELLNRPAVIAGSGPEEQSLIEAAQRSKADVTFVKRPTDEELVDLYRRAAALVFPAVEDFGIIPLEAQACATPVAAIAEGGVLDTVVPGLTGEFAVRATDAALAEATERAISLDLRLPEVADHLDRFSYATFRDDIIDWISEATW